MRIDLVTNGNIVWGSKGPGKSRSIYSYSQSLSRHGLTIDPLIAQSVASAWSPETEKLSYSYLFVPRTLEKHNLIKSMLDSSEPKVVSIQAVRNPDEDCVLLSLENGSLIGVRSERDSLLPFTFKKKKRKKEIPLPLLPHTLKHFDFYLFEEPIIKFIGNGGVNFFSMKISPKKILKQIFSYSAADNKTTSINFTREHIGGLSLANANILSSFGYPR